MQIYLGETRFRKVKTSLANGILAYFPVVLLYIFILIYLQSTIGAQHQPTLVKHHANVKGNVMVYAM